MNSCWVPHAGSENHCETRKSLKICHTLIRSKPIVPLSRTSTNWNDASTACGPLWVARIECAIGEWHSIYALAFVLEADILSTYCNKDDVMWHVWLFWETITASHVIVCCHSVNHSNIHLITALTAQSDTSKFPKVAQAHTLGEVGNLGTDSLRACSGTILPIFIEIGSYLTDKE